MPSSLDLCVHETGLSLNRKPDSLLITPNNLKSSQNSKTLRIDFEQHVYQESKNSVNPLQRKKQHNLVENIGDDDWKEQMTRHLNTQKIKGQLRKMSGTEWNMAEAKREINGMISVGNRSRREVRNLNGDVGEVYILKDVERCEKDAFRKKNASRQNNVICDGIKLYSEPAQVHSSKRIFQSTSV